MRAHRQRLAVRLHQFGHHVLRDGQLRRVRLLQGLPCFALPALAVDGRRQPEGGGGAMLVVQVERQRLAIQGRGRGMIAVAHGQRGVRAPAFGARFAGVRRQTRELLQRQGLQRLVCRRELVAAFVQGCALGGDAQAQAIGRLARGKLRAGKGPQRPVEIALHGQHGREDEGLFGRLRRPLVHRSQHRLLAVIVAAHMAGVRGLQARLDELRGKPHRLHQRLPRRHPALQLQLQQAEVVVDFAVFRRQRAGGQQRLLGPAQVAGLPAGQREVVPVRGDLRLHPGEPMERARRLRMAAAGMLRDAQPEQGGFAGLAGRRKLFAQRDRAFHVAGAAGGGDGFGDVVRRCGHAVRPGGEPPLCKRGRDIPRPLLLCHAVRSVDQSRTVARAQ